MIDSIVKYVVGRVRLIGNSDGTLLGNYLDRLKTLPVPDRSANGNLTAASQSLEIVTDGCAGVTFSFSGTWVATIIFEATTNGSTWFAIKADNVQTLANVASTTANGNFHLACGSFQKVRAFVSAYTSGTISVVANTGASRPTNQLQAQIFSPLPAFSARVNQVLAAGRTTYNSYTMSQKIAFTQFYLGGRGPGQATMWRYVAATTNQVPSGTFETDNDVTVVWQNTSIGDEALTAWARSTAQFHEGASSASKNFAKSDGNNYPQISYIWSTAIDMSVWRYISAWVRVTVAAGGNQTRTVSVILEDSNGATRTYSIVGSTTTAPFNTEQWLNILGEIANPTSESGTFDASSVKKIHLKLQDGGNKTGTIYWDDIENIGSMTLIERIYIDANRSFNLPLNPTEIFETSEVLLISNKNNDTVSREYTVAAKGVQG